MKQYRVKKSFPDQNGEHKHGDSIYLSGDRATKLVSMGYVTPEQLKPMVVKIDATGMEEVGNALKEATDLLDSQSREIEQLKSDLEDSKVSLSDLIASLKEASSIQDFTNIVKTLGGGSPVPVVFTVESND